jgi:methylglutaconyl-CoA hydratase
MTRLLVEFQRLDPAPIGVATLKRGEKRNALSVALIEQITAAVLRAGDDRTCRALIIRSEGPSFCAGLDLKEASAPRSAERSAGALAEMYDTITASPLVTIAAAQGSAIGGGAGLVLACDFALATENFTIAFPEVHRGLVAALVTMLLRRQVSDRVARELVLLGADVPARRAAELGLVNRIVPLDRLNDEALELARQICQGAPGAIVRSKRFFEEMAQPSVRAQLRRALTYHLEARNSSESEEGIRAFLEKSAPRWGDRAES